MDQTLEVKKSVLIDASLEKIWDVMTMPEHIEKYLHGTETITDWKVGSNIIFQGEYEGHKYKDKGIVQSNKHMEELSYLYFSNFSGLEDKPENYALVKYSFSKNNDGKVSLTWSQKGYPDVSRKEHSESGMDPLLGQIKKIAESI